jgi:chromate reductase
MQLVPADATLNIFELDGIPGFNQDEEENPPATVMELKKRIREADAVLIVTPEYNYSVPGVLKNAIDWASRPYGDSAWNGKPAAIMGASVGTLGTARTISFAPDLRLSEYVAPQPAGSDDRQRRRTI